MFWLIQDTKFLIVFLSPFGSKRIYIFLFTYFVVMNNKRVSFIYRVIMSVITWFALGLQLYILIDNTPGNGLTPIQAIGRFLFFFTILSNLLVAISLAFVLIAPGSVAGRFFSKPSVITAVTEYIFIVGLVYNIILRNLWQPVGFQLLADNLLHVVVPALFVSYWLLFVPKNLLQWKHPFTWLYFPAAYLLYALIRGAAEDFYPYPFINVTELGYGKVFLNSLGLMIVFLAVGFLLVGIGKGMYRK